MDTIPEALQEMANLLRAGGIEVTLAEMVDAVRGWQATPVAYWPEVLQVTLVKRYEDLKPLAALLALTGSCSGAEQPACKNRGMASGQATRHAGGQLPVLDVMAALFSGSEGDLNDLAEQAIDLLGELGAGALDHLEGKVREARLALNWHMVRHRLKVMENEGRQEARIALQSLQLLETLIRRNLELRLVQELGPEAMPAVLRTYNLAEKGWSELAEGDLAVMRPYLKKLGRYLGNKYSWRYRPAPRGKIDLRRTVKEACRHGGIPWQIRYRGRRRERPVLFVLGDISGSVAPFSVFMLELIYAMQHAFRQVRTFVFVDDLAEVTGAVREAPTATAMEQVARFARCSVSGYSDFGRICKLFLERYGEVLTPDTTILILGDARNNWRQPEVESFAAICRQAGKVVWLNPQPEASWNTMDSSMALYAPFCHAVRECSNLKQLIAIAREGF
ncbi:VWA domain-containing protein [Moorella sp. Hama-1]|uniref:VWA domain-containing protein n=1 Tax=Moorella sp. Hama-1 TaxID=2138101 RepID=UPI000D64DD04|nr:VWA domain-containing protein [Moorella sp. Hama-1]BCV20635.1 VWA containing CoxE-like protein [Moorella sp. Hama-1]